MGFKAGWSGGRGLHAPDAPLISGAVLIGQNITITPSVTGGTPASFAEYSDGVATGRSVIATGAPVPYAVVNEDVGATITFRAVNLAGSSAASNALTTDLALLPEGVSFYEPRNPGAGNVISGAFAGLKDLGVNGADLSTASAGVRPAQSTSGMLSGQTTALFDGVDDWMRNTTFPFVPRHILSLTRFATWQANRAVVSFNGNAMQLRMAGISNCWEWQPTATGASSQTSTRNMNDGYFRLAEGKDNGTTSQSLRCIGSDAVTPEGTDTNANVTARATAPGVLSLGAFVTGTFPCNIEQGLLVISPSVLSADSLATVEAYSAYHYVNRQAASLISFVGSRTTNSTAQPRLYETHHDGVSGQTMAGLGLLMNGLWGAGGGTTIGSPDDPGPGNRGVIETLATTQGIANMVGLAYIGTNDATSGAVPGTIASLWVQRMFNIAALGPGSLVKLYIAKLVDRTDASSGVANPNIAVWNTVTLPALITTLTGLGFPVAIWDPTVGWNTGTCLLADGLHPNYPTGVTVMATAAKSAVHANALDVPPYVLLPMGDSYIDGDPTLIPQATSGIRSALSLAFSV